LRPVERDFVRDAQGRRLNVGNLHVNVILVK
jgi:hypothetical protein